MDAIYITNKENDTTILVIKAQVVAIAALTPSSSNLLLANGQSIHVNGDVKTLARQFGIIPVNTDSNDHHKLPDR